MSNLIRLIKVNSSTAKKEEAATKKAFNRGKTKLLGLGGMYQTTTRNMSHQPGFTSRSPQIGIKTREIYHPLIIIFMYLILYLVIQHIKVGPIPIFIMTFFYIRAGTIMKQPSFIRRNRLADILMLIASLSLFIASIIMNLVNSGTL